jgi:hypothetical protein
MKRRLAAVSLSGALAVVALAASPAANARVDLSINLGLPGVAVAPPPPVVYAPPGNYGPPPPVVYNGYYGPGWNHPHYRRPPPRPPMRRPPPGRGPGPGGRSH